MGASRPLVITAGEPAGIGPELCLTLAHESLPCRVVVISDPDLLRHRAEQAGIDVAIVEINVEDAANVTANAGELLVIAERFPAAVDCGRLNPANSSALLEGLPLAVSACLDG